MRRQIAVCTAVLAAAAMGFALWGSDASASPDVASAKKGALSAAAMTDLAPSGDSDLSFQSSNGADLLTNSTNAVLTVLVHLGQTTGQRAQLTVDGVQISGGDTGSSSSGARTFVAYDLAPGKTLKFVATGGSANARILSVKAR